MELSKLLRPFLTVFIQRAVECNLHVAVVTFSKQTELIRNCLEHVYPLDVAKKIIVKGRDGTWAHGSELFGDTFSHFLSREYLDVVS